MEQDINKRNSFISNFKGTRLFLAKILVGLAIFAIYINSLLPQYEQGYNASLIDKAGRLKAITEPKIVLLGNSNVAFGIDSKLIEAETGMPVVNMGLHANLGNAFHEEMAKLNVTPRDIYVVCHTGYNDDDKFDDRFDRKFEAELAWITIENHFQLWNLLRFSDIKEMAESFPVYLKKSLTLAGAGTGNRKPDSTIYARAAFNEYGDFVSLRKGKFYTGDGKGMRSVPTVGSLAVTRINALNQYLVSKGATLLVAGYPIRNGSLAGSASQYESFQEELAEKLDCPVISNYVDYMFDFRYFYDTNYHLNSEGAALRTRQLISDVKGWMQSGAGIAASGNSYADIVSDVNLPHIDDFYEYVDALCSAKNRYTVFISCPNNPHQGRGTELFDALRALAPLHGEELQRNNYAALIENGTIVQEAMQDTKIELLGKFDSEKMTYSIISDGDSTESFSSIRLNGEECSENVKGLNIVVYSNETHRRLDEVGFDFSSPEEIKAHRFAIKDEP